MHNVRVPGMLHGRVVRPRGQAAYGQGAKPLSVDESVDQEHPGRAGRPQGRLRRRRRAERVRRDPGGGPAEGQVGREPGAAGQRQPVRRDPRDEDERPRRGQHRQRRRGLRAGREDGRGVVLERLPGARPDGPELRDRRRQGRQRDGALLLAEHLRPAEQPRADARRSTRRRSASSSSRAPARTATRPTTTRPRPQRSCRRPRASPCACSSCAGTSTAGTTTPRRWCSTSRPASTRTASSSPTTTRPGSPAT